MWTTAWTDFIICFFFGWLGAHRFRLRQFGWGVLYLFTGGIFCIGWFIDIVRFFIAAATGEQILGNRRPIFYVQVPLEGVQAAQPGARYVVPGPAPSGRALSDEDPLPVAASNLLLRDGDICRYCDHAVAVLDQDRERCAGLLSISDQRIVFSGERGAFDRRIDELSAVTPHVDAISFQFGSHHHTLLTADSDYITQLLLRIVNLGA